MRYFFVGSCALLVAALASGCSIIVDGAIGNGGGGMDAGTGGSPCARLPDGTACAVEGILDNLVCNGGVCDLSVCGDGLEDDRNDEDCDDGNTVEGDGCDTDCEFSCVDDSECDDGVTCNGAETCGDDNACAAGTQAPAGTSCMLDGGDTGMCREGLCVTAGCGDSVPLPPEECDDGNTVDGDGCDSDCTFTCENNDECDDGSVCTGTETCDIVTHTCSSTDAIVCPDVMCADVTCDPVMGCITDRSRFDVDRDGHYSMALCGGDDCNDMDASTFTGAGELCDDIDHDCDGVAMEGATPWYPDCDEDGYAASGAVATESCDRPTSRPTICPLGGWTSRSPLRSDIDCDDSVRTARPGQTTYYSTGFGSRGTNFDYNCDGEVRLQYPYHTGTSCGLLCQSFYESALAPRCGTNMQLFHSCSRVGLGCMRTPTTVPVRCL